MMTYGMLTTTNTTKQKSNSVVGPLNKALIYIFLFNAIFFPVDTFNLKIISLGLLLFINLPIILNPKTKMEKTVVFFGLFLTLFNILFSALKTKNIIADIRLGYPGFILLLYPVIKRYSINFYKAVVFIVNLLALFSVSMAILHFTRLLDMDYNPILIWYKHSANAMIGQGDELPLRFMFFFKTSPLFFIALTDALRRKRFFWIIISSIAIIISGTRANILMLLFVFFIYLCFLQPAKKKRMIFLFIFLLAALVIIIDGRVIDFFVDMFKRKGSSDAVRDGHLEGIFAFWKGSPSKFILGSGFSSEFYSFGRDEILSNIELSYWNLLRQVGIVPFCLLMIMYLYPVAIMIKNKCNYALILAYAAYLFIAYTNPFLYSSTGITFLLLMYCKCTDKKTNNGVKKHEGHYSCRRIGNKTLSFD